MTKKKAVSMRELKKQIEELIEGVEVDLDAPLPDDEEDSTEDESKDPMPNDQNSHDS